MINKKISITKVIEILFIILSSICVFFSLFKICFFELDENQILYLFSTGAQVIAGLFGITLAGYIFFNDRLDKEVHEDESLYDAVEALKKYYYTMIGKMGAVCIISIASSLLNIALYSFLQNNVILNIFIVNEAVLLLLLEIFYIVIFVLQVTDPNKILKLSNVAKFEIENNDEAPGDLAEFLKYYNMIESLVISTANDLIKPTVTLSISQKFEKPKIIQSLYILNSKQIISKSMIDEIDEIRKYRNFTVHSSNPAVTNNMFQHIKQLYADIESHVNQYLDRKNTERIDNDD